ncbi:MAG: hypothetical protein ABMA25_05830 [Ilumatobacteraceae bacterium]
MFNGRAAGQVLTVYLDQNIWIEMKNSITGKPNGSRAHGLFERCLAAAASGSFRFVLSFSHYEETTRWDTLDERRKLATVMWRVAGQHRMALPETLIRQEVAGALHQIYGLEGERPIVEPFGLGADFAMGFPLIADALASLDGLEQMPPSVQAQARDFLEFGALVGLDGDYRDFSLPRPKRDNNQRYVDNRNEVTQKYAAWGHSRERADHFSKAEGMIDLLPVLDEIATPLGLSIDDLIDGGRERIEAFLSLLPMDTIVRSLHKTTLPTNRQWEPNDHNDVVYMSAAAAYCDVVVGEREWIAKLKQGSCPTRAPYLFSKPGELSDLLDSATGSA